MDSICLKQKLTWRYRNPATKLLVQKTEFTNQQMIKLCLFYLFIQTAVLTFTISCSIPFCQHFSVNPWCRKHGPDSSVFLRLTWRNLHYCTDESSIKVQTFLYINTGKPKSVIHSCGNQVNLKRWSQYDDQLDLDQYGL